MSDPSEILDNAFRRAVENPDRPLINQTAILERVETICRNTQNRAGARLLPACLLAKAHQPRVDIRKPYTEIGDADSYSGRTYDETYITAFISRHGLPCNPTTAFLTPALRNRNILLTPDVNLVGRPPSVYQAALELLASVHAREVKAEDLLAEMIRWLIVIRAEKQQRMDTLLAGIRPGTEAFPPFCRSDYRLDTAARRVQRIKPPAGADCCRSLPCRIALSR